VHPFLIDKFYTEGNESIKTEFEKKVLLDVSEEQCVEIKFWHFAKAMEDMQREQHHHSRRRETSTRVHFNQYKRSKVNALQEDPATVKL